MEGKFIMVDNENLVTEEVTENVEDVTTEQTTEQVETPEKVYTEAEFNEKLNEISGKRASRKEAKIRKEYDRKYGELMGVLSTATGIEDVDEMTSKFREHYEQRGIQFQSKPNYSARDNEILAKAEADEIINEGYEEVVDEINRLADIGIENLSAREKAILKSLAEYQKNTETSRELAKIGVTEDVYNSPEFKEFASQFNSNVPIRSIYDMYTKQQPKKEYKDMGSIKHTTAKDTGVKDFYSKEEAKKFTVEDFNRNPALFEAVQESMRKW